MLDKIWKLCYNSVEKKLFSKKRNERKQKNGY